jgi:hypothetical protein
MQDDSYSKDVFDLFEILCELRNPDPPEICDILHMLISPHYEGRRLALEQLKKLTTLDRDSADYCRQTLNNERVELHDHRRHMLGLTEALEWLLEEDDEEPEEKAARRYVNRFDGDKDVVDMSKVIPLSAEELGELEKRLLSTFEQEDIYELLTKIEAHHAVEALPTLRKVYLRTSYYSTRSHIAMILGAFRNERAYKTLCDILHDDRTSGQRGTPVYALRNYNYSTAFDELMDAALGEFYEARTEACRKISRLHRGEIPQEKLVTARRRALSRMKQLQEDIAVIIAAYKYVTKIAKGV